MLYLSCLTLHTLGNLISSTVPPVREDVAIAMTAALGGPVMVGGVAKQIVPTVLEMLVGVILRAAETTVETAVVAVVDGVLQGQMSSSTAKWGNA